jgi:chaperonin GroES
METEKLAEFVQSTNIAESLDNETLDKIGLQVCEWFDVDMAARFDWSQRNEEYLKLATQVVETKTTPWPNAANVKFPLLTTAAMQFAARAYPALVPGPNLVAGLVIGRDEGGMKQQSAQRVGKHMSYQLLHEMAGWEEDMDKLCMMLPIVGCVFKKTYWDAVKGHNCSELIMPDELVIDYYAKSVELASRKSQIIWRTPNEIQERVNRGLFLDIELGRSTGRGTPSVRDNINGTKEPAYTEDAPHKFIECHCSWDLDDDNYKEPYVITVHYETKKVVRIITRFDAEGIETYVDEKTGKEKLVKITPIEYFTKFGFIPNPDGSIYDLGFGLLLGGINESINTLTNQLLDSGTLNNLQAGFLGRGIRVRGGNSRFSPGEWKPVDFTGDDIKKHIFPLPTKEPSVTLFKLLETLVTSGKELASVAEIFVGKMPGQNTPATTTMATIEQGLKVFTAIYKRIYRALGQEYQKLFKLNAIYADEATYFTINQPEGPEGQQVYKADYDVKNLAVKPNADPNIVSSAQKLMKVQSYGSLLQLGTISPPEYTKRYLEAVEAENIQALMNYQPPPNPEQQKMQAEMQMKQMDGQMKQAEAQQKAQLAQQKADLDAAKAQLDAQMKQLDLAIKAAEAQMSARKAEMEMHHATRMSEIEARGTLASTGLDLKAKEAQHGQNLRHKEEQNEVKKKQMAQKPKGESSK